MESYGFSRPTAKDKSKMAPIKFALSKSRVAAFHIGPGKDAALPKASVFGRLSPSELEKSEEKIKKHNHGENSSFQPNQVTEINQVILVTEPTSLPPVTPFQAFVPPVPLPPQLKPISTEELEKQLEMFKSVIEEKPMQQDIKEENHDEAKSKVDVKEEKRSSPSPPEQKPKSASPLTKPRFERRRSPSPVEKRKRKSPPRSRSRSRTPEVSKQRYQHSRRSCSRSKSPRRRTRTRSPRRRTRSRSLRRRSRTRSPRENRRKAEVSKKKYSDKYSSSSCRSDRRTRSRTRTKSPFRSRHRSRSRSRTPSRSKNRSRTRSPVRSKHYSRTKSPTRNQRSRTRSPIKPQQRPRSRSKSPTHTRGHSLSRTRSPTPDRKSSRSPTQRQASKLSTPRKRDRSEQRSPSRSCMAEEPNKKKVPFSARWDNKKGKDDHDDKDGDKVTRTSAVSPIKSVLSSPRKSTATVESDKTLSLDPFNWPQPHDSFTNPSAMLEELEKYLTPDKETGFPKVSETVMGAFPIPFTLEGVGAVLCWPYYTAENIIVMVPYLGLQKPPDETSVENMIVVPTMVEPPPLLMSGCPVGYTPLNLASIPTYDPTRAIPPPPPTATAPLNQPTKPAVQKLVRIQQKERERRKRLAAEKAAAAQAATALQSDTPTTGSESMSSKTTTPQPSSSRLTELTSY